MPDGIEYEADLDNGGAGHNVPGVDQDQLAVDVGLAILDAYVEHAWDRCPRSGPTPSSRS